MPLITTRNSRASSDPPSSNPYDTASGFTLLNIATPLYDFIPRYVMSYPDSANASSGNSLSWTLVSWRHSTSGFCRTSQSSTIGKRFRRELTLKVAIFMEVIHALRLSHPSKLAAGEQVEE